MLWLAPGIGYLGDFCGFALTFGNHREPIILGDEDIYIWVQVISNDDETARVGADALVLGLRHLEEDVAILPATFAHDVHVPVHPM